MSRIILKISGESLKKQDEVVAKENIQIVLETIKILRKHNHQVAVVIGGGNFFRGREHPDMNPINRDTIGMISSIVNALHLKDFLEKNNLNVIISTPFTFPGLIEDISDGDLKNKYDNGSIVIFAAGVGKSGYSTDSGVILASDKINGNLIIKMTNVDGVYDSDPRVNSDAKKYETVSYDEVISKNLNIMDQYAIRKAKEKNIKILVLNFTKYQELEDYFNGIKLGTIIE